MPSLPTFETERLILRPRVIGDLESCLALDSDPEVVRYVTGPWSDPAEHRAFVTQRITAAYPEGMGYWVVSPKSSPNVFLGWILLIPLDGVGPETEIGWRLGRAAWGKGYATEAALPVLRHGFGAVGLDRVIALVHPDNRRSMRVAEKIGLRLDGDRTYDGDIATQYALTRAAAMDDGLLASEKGPD